MSELSRITIFLFLIFILPVHCATGNKASTMKQPDPEGFIFLDIRLFAETDEQGFARLDKPVNDTAFTPVNRKMYIHQHYLIDIIKNVQVSNGQYIKTDTSGYEMYDLLKQQFAGFNTLTPDADLRVKGTLSGAGGSFSNSPEYDPMNGIPDSLWHITNTVINGDTTGVVSFNVPAGTIPENADLFKKTKFWVNYTTKNFPLQLSYTLSKKLNNAFVFKMQLPSPDGAYMMVTSLDYQQAALPDTILMIFKRWSELMNGW